MRPSVDGGTAVTGLLYVELGTAHPGQRFVAIVSDDGQHNRRRNQ